MQTRLIVQFDQLNEAGFQAKADVIIRAMIANPHFPEPWPAPAPSTVSLTAALETYRDAVQACGTRDTVKIGQRKVAREVLTEMLRKLAQYIEFADRADAQALATTRFDLRRENSRQPGTDQLPAPDGLKLLHGQGSGSVDVRMRRLDGAGSYEMQVTQGDPMLDANWKHAQTAIGSTGITITDLPVKQDSWVRVRGVNGKGGGRWSDPVSIFVL